MPVRHFKIVYRAGAAQARNFGVSLAKTDYVAFLDDDDLWSKDYLQGMMRYIKSTSPDCIIARLDQLIEGRVLPYKNAHGHLNKDVLLVKNPGTTDSTMVVKKNSFLKLGGCNVRLPTGYDKALALEFVLQKYKVVAAPDCQAILRQHNKGDRLSGALTMAEGIFQFYKYYKKEMNLNQRIFNLLKVYKNRWLSKKSIIDLVMYIIFGFLYLPKYILTNILKKK